MNVTKKKKKTARAEYIIIIRLCFHVRSDRRRTRNDTLIKKKRKEKNKKKINRAANECCGHSCLVVFIIIFRFLNEERYRCFLRRAIFIFTVCKPFVQVVISRLIQKRRFQSESLRKVIFFLNHSTRLILPLIDVPATDINDKSLRISVHKLEFLL